MTLSSADHPHVPPEMGPSSGLSLLGVARTPRQPHQHREQDPSGNMLFQTELAQSTTYG